MKSIEVEPDACDQVTHLDAAGRIVEGPSRPQPGDIIVIVQELVGEPEVILWFMPTGELVQLVEHNTSKGD